MLTDVYAWFKAISMNNLLYKLSSNSVVHCRCMLPCLYSSLALSLEIMLCKVSASLCVCMCRSKRESNCITEGMWHFVEGYL